MDFVVFVVFPGKSYFFERVGAVVYAYGQKTGTLPVDGLVDRSGGRGRPGRDIRHWIYRRADRWEIQKACESRAGR